jgi:MYXO-CTERM domain-containing protein
LEQILMARNTIKLGAAAAVVGFALATPAMAQDSQTQGGTGASTGTMNNQSPSASPSAGATTPSQNNMSASTGSGSASTGSSGFTDQTENRADDRNWGWLGLLGLAGLAGLRRREHHDHDNVRRTTTSG